MFCACLEVTVTSSDPCWGMENVQRSGLIQSASAFQSWYSKEVSPLPNTCQGWSWLDLACPVNPDQGRPTEFWKESAVIRTDQSIMLAKSLICWFLETWDSVKVKSAGPNLFVYFPPQLETLCTKITSEHEMMHSSSSCPNDHTAFCNKILILISTDEHKHKWTAQGTEYKDMLLYTSFCIPDCLTMRTQLYFDYFLAALLCPQF